MYDSYLPLYTIFIILFFNHMIQNQIYTATATTVSPVVSDNEKSHKLCYQFEYVQIFDYHKVIVWVLLTIIYIISHFIFQTSDSKPTLL